MFDASTERLGDELSSVIIQSVTNATVAVVNAIEQNCNTTVNLDAGYIASSTIREINRRTIAKGGISPLIMTGRGTANSHV